MRSDRWWRRTLLAVACAIVPLAARAGPFDGTISTLAGDGAIGVDQHDADGPAFVFPAGVATGPDGTVYVADAGAQRIRTIRDGAVATLAGSGSLDKDGLWVPGGYADGPAGSARFSMPSGIAVDAAGRVFVSDTANHCVRLIDRGGVTTYAGSTDAGFADGPRANALFADPMQLAIGPDRSLYVADYGNGLRKIDASGNVTTVFRSKTVMGVAVSPGAEHTIFIAQGTGLAEILRGNTYVVNNFENIESPGDIRTLDDVGHPYMIAALDDNHAVYTDAWTGAIRYYEGYENDVRVVLGERGSDPLDTGSGFGDGALAHARVAEPIGVAPAGSDGVYVADAGNRRIRVIRGLAIRSAFEPGNAGLYPPGVPPSHALRVAVVGNSYVWTDSVWDDSLERALEDALAASLKRPVWVEGVRMPGTSLSTALDYLSNVVAPAHRYDVVVLLLDDQHFVVEGAGWEHVLADRLPRTASDLEADRMRFFVAYHPTSSDLAPWGQTPYPPLFDGGEYGPSFRPPRELPPMPTPTASAGSATAPSHRSAPEPTSARSQPVPSSPYPRARVDRDLARAGVTFFDLWPAFIAADKAPDHRLLFGTVDAHFTPEGRTFTGELLARDLAEKLASPAP